MSATDEEQEVRQIYNPVVDTPTNYRREGEGAQPPLDYPVSYTHLTLPTIYSV